MDYKCLKCGSQHGEAIDDSSENWFWRVIDNGRIGPFCSQGCSKEFRLSDDPVFSLVEWERLHFLKWRVMSGELLDPNQIAS
jgi:hypothetical protein